MGKFSQQIADGEARANLVARNQSFLFFRNHTLLT